GVRARARARRLGGHGLGQPGSLFDRAAGARHRTGRSHRNIGLHHGRDACAQLASARPGPALSWRRFAAPGTIEGWSKALARADAAPQLLSPGLLASQIPGGAAYVGIDGAGSPGAAVAADRGGRVAAVSIGAPAGEL